MKKSRIGKYFSDFFADETQPVLADEKHGNLKW
jgi:hypothetical protein